ncbi:hypothetical protein OG389_13555 [Streptomyces sp. NBC_00435]|uniref:DUF6059 family protein n=1 Tax=Streptomyces sp. NBC_00435 TaxID=2903649 RepID=UPI002E1D95B8
MPYAEWWKRRTVLGRVRRWLAEALMAYGATYLHGEGQEAAVRILTRPAPARPAPRYLHEPPAGHPERLRPDIPLSDLELDLGRQLMAAYHRGDEEDWSTA